MLKLAAAALLLAAAMTAQIRTVPRSLADMSGAIEELAENASPAVVHISVRNRAPIGDEDTQRTGFVAERRATGSGVIVAADGYVITNAHVVAGARSIDVSVIDRNSKDSIDDHRHYPARVAGVDADTDLALLKIDAKGLPTLSFLDSDKLRQGQLVVALGSPLGLDNSLTVGFVSAPVRYLRPDHPMFYIQTDAAINPGNSGGPLLDIEGRIAGINTLILTQSGGSEGIGLAIPANTVAHVYEHLRKEGRVRRGVIGILPETITPLLSSALGLSHHTGVILSDVKPHGAAEAAGLQLGDLVLAVNGAPLKESRQLSAAIFQRTAGEEITLDIERGGQRLRKTIAVQERPDQPAGLAELANQSQLVRRLGILALTVDEKVTPVLPDLRRLSGVAVTAIPAEYAALNPGLTAGDVIYEVNAGRVTSFDQLKSALDARKSGDPIALLVERSGQILYVSFELD